MIRFHCCVVPTIQCRGTTSSMVLCTVPEKLGEHCWSEGSEQGVKPVKNEGTGTKAWEGGAPSCGIGNGPFAAKRLAKLPAPARKPTWNGKVGGVIARLSTAPKSSRTE